MIAGVKARIKARDFLLEHLADLPIPAARRRRMERALAWAFQNVRGEIAREIESVWGSSLWMEYSKAIAKRLRST